MLKKTLYALCTVAAFTLVIISCQKSADRSAVQPQSSSSAKSGFSLLEDCSWTDTVINSTSASSPGYYYGDWQPVTWTPTGGPAIQQEGQYISFSRPTSTSWYIGDIHLDSVCYDWEDIAQHVVVKNASGNVGSDPNLTAWSYTFIPQNVLGLNGSFFGYSFARGFYSYVIGQPTPQRALLVWKDTNSSSPTFVSNPQDDASEALVIKVDSIKANGLSASVYLKYRKVL
ncbi:MAG: hypothetical protein QM731_13735 [Chitinophagaceae bacterium]